jgi:hypothetical protein
LYTIRADFQRFADVHLGDLFGQTGVYVLWDAQAKARPTYIGEGTVLSRLASHAKRDGRMFAQPLDGYIAIMSGSSQGIHKTESLAVERLLLDVARETDREPAVNVRPGAGSVINLLCEDELLRIAVRGYDPLIPPHESRRLSGVKEIKAWSELQGSYVIDHDWTQRRRRGSYI